MKMQASHKLHVNATYSSVPPVKVQPWQRHPVTHHQHQHHNHQHQHPSSANDLHQGLKTSLFAAVAVSALLHAQIVPGAGAAAELVESSIQTEGNIPSELSAAGEARGPRLSSFMEGSSKRQVEGCTRRCVPTCIRGGEGAPGLGPISLRKEIIVFKDGFRSRQYCLSECTQVCALMAENEKQQQQQQQQQQQEQQRQRP